MISQADIIRTLVNKNCTNESVMSTALSQACTLPKLLEKLTEAERFDLAIDISMKLGLDVVLLWKTWAMRCLKNRNFQAAREKFRHCFLRVRLPGNRFDPIQSNILNEILIELTRMDETKLTLAEEIELIKQRKSRDETLKRIIDDTYVHSHQTVICKPKIYSECIYYLKEYGNLQDNIKFYTRNSLWNEAVKILLDKSNNQVNLDKFFVTEVVQYSTSTGKFNDLIRALLELDPTLVNSTKYFKVIYNFCLNNRRYNLLYYVQNLVGDNIAAAVTQIDRFFLRKPVYSYTELNKRMTCLILARDNYSEYLKKLVNESAQTSEISSVLKLDKRSGLLFASESKKEVEKRIRMIELQIDITKNFSLNEVSGCMNCCESSSNTGSSNSKDKAESTTNSPVTLFDQSETRKTFLAALVLIYYDLSCSTYFSKNGLDLANRLIDNQGLDKLQVFKTAMRVIIEDESCNLIENARLLLERIKEDCQQSRSANRQQTATNRAEKVTSRKHSQSPRVEAGSLIGYNDQTAASSTNLATKDGTVKHLKKKGNQLSDKQLSTSLNDSQSVCDEVIRDSIISCKEPDYKMELAGLLSSEAKIELYIEHGKLSNAQRLAFSMNRPDYVLSIIEEAIKLNQDHVKTVCELWLAKHETRNFTS